MRNLPLIACYASSIFALFPTSSHAQTETVACPDYFRFVDFGLDGPNDSLLRGGPVFRTRDQERTPLLEDNGAVCLDITPIFSDGHGHPIPIASGIKYAGAGIAEKLLGLTVTRVNGTDLELSQASRERHRKAVKAAVGEVVKGDTYLCVKHEADTVSCEIANPFKGSASAVFHCGSKVCELPVLAMDNNLVLSGRWSLDGISSVSELGALASATMIDIRSFISTMTSR